MRIDSSTQRQFIAAMRTRGLQVHGDLISDGQWHRCDATNKPNGRNDGSYRLFADGPAPWGMYRNWTDGRGVDYWRGDSSRPLTDTEQRELDRRMEEQRIEAEKLAAEAAAEARDRARKDWAEARPAPPDHPYLQRKRIKAHDIRVSDTMLLVPMFASDDDDNEPVNLEFIDTDGSKWFLRGGRAKGCYFPIRGPDEISTVVLCEGFATGASIAEATGHHIIVAFGASNLVGVATVLRAYLNRTAARERREMDKFLAQIPLQPERCPASRFDPKLIIAADDDWKTEGNPGIVAALSAARVSGARVAVPIFGDKRREKETDFTDLAVAFSLAEVKEDIEKAVAPNALLTGLLLADPQSAHSSAMVRQLAELKQTDPVQYETLIANLKKKHVRIRPLEQSIKSAANAAREVGQREEKIDVLYHHWTVEPWDEPVGTGDLLWDIQKRIKRHVATLGDRTIIVALWIMLSWVHDIATHSPILLVTSAEADSGKTTLLGIIVFLAKRALLSVSISGPALFRSIAKWEPTMIVDEGDTAFENNEDLRAVFNSGWTRHHGVIRCEPETHEPRMYPTFCPKAVGMKGKKLPDTTMSRCIIMETKRKRADEPVEDFDHEDDSELAELRRRLARWSVDIAQTLRAAEPDMPSGFINRTRMNWQMLLAIAAAAGDDVERRALATAKGIEGARTQNASNSLGIELLSDIRVVFDEEDESQLTTSTIIGGLVSMEEKPWSEYGRAQKPISPKQLATLLKPFGIHSREIHEHDSHTKGHKREQFEDVWKRYLPPSVEDLPRSRANLDKSMAYDDFAAAREDDSARDEIRANSLNNKESRGCAGKNNPRAAPKEKNG